MQSWVIEEIRIANHELIEFKLNRLKKNI